MVLTHIALSATGTQVVSATPFSMLSGISGSFKQDECTITVYDAKSVADAVAGAVAFEFDAYLQNQFSFVFNEAIFLQGIVVKATIVGTGPANIIVDWE
tara:strand:- start:193 stop:489 length:297 start_codon:yes stop_codon:yes gene_type:complete